MGLFGGAGPGDGVFRFQMPASHTFMKHNLPFSPRSAQRKVFFFFCPPLLVSPIHHHASSKEPLLDHYKVKYKAEL